MFGILERLITVHGFGYVANEHKQAICPLLLEECKNNAKKSNMEFMNIIKKKDSCFNPEYIDVEVYKNSGIVRYSRCTDCNQKLYYEKDIYACNIFIEDIQFLYCNKCSKNYCTKCYSTDILHTCDAADILELQKTCPECCEKNTDNFCLICDIDISTSRKNHQKTELEIKEEMYSELNVKMSFGEEAEINTEEEIEYEPSLTYNPEYFYARNILQTIWMRMIYLDKKIYALYTNNIWNLHDYNKENLLEVLHKKWLKKEYCIIELRSLQEIYAVFRIQKIDTYTLLTLIKKHHKKGTALKANFYTIDYRPLFFYYACSQK